METKVILTIIVYLMLGIQGRLSSLNQTKEYVDSCIGKFNTLPRTITRTEIDEITKKLEPYSVTILY